MNLRDLRNEIQKTEITYDYEETYCNLKNTVIDYMNENQDFDLEDVFDNIIDYELAEIYAEQQLKEGGLVRLYYFLGDANCNNELFKIDGYGNLTNLDRDDLEDLKEEILNRIDLMED